MKGSRKLPPLPGWSSPSNSIELQIPCYVRDEPRYRALEQMVRDAVAPSVGGATAATVQGPEHPAETQSCLPFFLVGSRDGAETAPPGPVGLGVAHAHAPPTPQLADPYDGTAFEIAKAISDRSELHLTHLVIGLWGSEQPPTRMIGRIAQAARFAFELRRAFGIEAPGLAILGGVRPRRRLLRRHQPAEADLVEAWDRVGRALGAWWSDFGLPLESVLLDLGAPGDALCVRLAVGAEATGNGWEPTVSCAAPIEALREVGGDDGPPGTRVRLLSALSPGPRGPSITLATEPMPRVLLLPVRRRIPLLPTAQDSPPEKHGESQSPLP